ncbi:MAG: hypothetical protein LBD28_05410 [Tannerellaceae bacterium]|jgi:antitoxin component YwqK of YwqJK toxin-antitoxin module|nr:hypothetical protein [Tannerellaceae bacterium]
MKNFLIIAALIANTLVAFAQQPVQIHDIKMINLGDGRLYATNDKDKALNGKMRIITGYTTEYIDAQFNKGYATGKWEYYKNNLLQKRMNYSEGLADGEVIEYHPDGETIKATATMVKGKVDGINYMYDRNGKKEYERSMRNGTADGYERRFDPDGNITEERFYKNGKADGKAFQIINRKQSDEYTMRASYLNGQYDGEYSETFANGNPKVKGAYTEGKRQGVWEYFKRDGTHAKPTEEYLDNTVIRRIEYFTDGKVSREVNFNNEGRKHGAEKEYDFEDGRLTKEQNYVDGKLLGRQMRRMSSNIYGRYFEYCTYNEAGKKHGDYLETFEDGGQMKSKGVYDNDKKVGLWIYGDDSGKVPPKEEVYNDRGALLSVKMYVTSASSGNYFELTHYNDRQQKDGEYLQIWEKGGKTKMKGQYSQGRQSGAWLTYDVDGKLLKEESKD